MFLKKARFGYAVRSRVFKLRLGASTSQECNLDTLHHFGVLVSCTGFKSHACRIIMYCILYRSCIILGEKTEKEIAC